MVERTKFQGVLNILSFNRHFYVIGVVLLIGLLSLFYLDIISLTLLVAGLLAVLYGLIAPLVVSAYVYDFSGYYEFTWVQPSQKKEHLKILNIHSGFDETSFILSKKFPEAKVKALDFYNPKLHTEQAIIRARKVTDKYPNSFKTSTTSFKEEDNSVDLVCLLSAAHEIRNADERVIFFKECRRVCKPEGKIVVMEHLRDFPNFMAFTIGVFHFHSNSTWIKCFKKSGFSKIEIKNFTPFLRTYNLTP